MVHLEMQKRLGCGPVALAGTYKERLGRTVELSLSSSLTDRIVGVENSSGVGDRGLISAGGGGSSEGS